MPATGIVGGAQVNAISMTSSTVSSGLVYFTTTLAATAGTVSSFAGGPITDCVTQYTV